MAINNTIPSVIVQLAAHVGRPCRMVCLGYPDMLVTEEQLAQLRAQQPPRTIEYREDSAAILRWHGLEGTMARLAETRSAFAALGIAADFIDIAASRGMEMVVDLNDPL